MRFLATLLLLLASPAAAAPFEPCPSITVGWALQYPPPITAVLYGQNGEVLYIVWNYTAVSAYPNVPLSVMQAFSSSKNPVQVYDTLVVPSYHPLLLTEKDNCPLLFERRAYFWLAPNPVTPVTPTNFVLLANAVNFVLLANGVGQLCRAGGC